MNLTYKSISLLSLCGGLAITGFGQTTESSESKVYTLDELIVEGEAAQVSQAYTPMKSGTKLIDTPSSVSIATEALLSAQGAVSLQDSIRNISGLMHQGNNYGIGDQLSIRGQAVSYTYDGLDAGSGGSGGGSGATVRSLTNVERIEVVKGAAGTLYGIGGAGGIVNLVEKRPQSTQQTRVEAYAGRWATFGGELDVTGPLSDQLAYRFTAATRESGGFRNFEEDRTEFYGSLQFKPNAEHSLLLTAASIADEVQVDSFGHPVRIYDIRSTTPDGVSAGDATLTNIPNGPDGGGRLQLTDAQRQQLLASLAPGDGGQPYDLGNSSTISPLARPTDGNEFRIKVRHDWAISDDSAFAHYAQVRSYGSDYVRSTGGFNYVYWNRGGSINAVPRAPLVVDGVLYPFAARRHEYRKFDFHEDSVQYFAEAKRRFVIGQTNHDLLLTAYGEWRDYETQSWSLYDADSSRSAASPVPYILDIRNPNWPTGRFEDYAVYPSSDYTKDVTSYGVGLQDVVSLPGNLTARLAIGWNRIDQDYDNNLVRTATDPDPLPVSSQDEGLLYNAGLTWRVLPHTSFFVATSQSRTALSVTGSVSLNNQPPDSESDNFEFGIKQEFLEGRLALSSAVFSTARTNLRYSNPDYDDNPASPTFNIDVDPNRYDGEDRTKGAEFDLNFSLPDHWMVNLNATYQDARTRRNPGTGNVTGLAKGTPRVYASVWLQHTLSPEIFGGRLTLGGGLRHVGRRAVNSTSFGIAQAFISAYTTVDAIVQFEASENWSMQLNLNNLANENYYELAQFLGGRPGEPTNTTLKVTYRF